jgi:thiol-disulfide isomerase/thioredoxin
MRSIPARLSILARAALLAGLLGASSFAQALEIKPFSAAALASAQKAGQPVAVHFHAEWCPTCRKQSTVLTQLKSDKSLEAVTVLVADYDAERELRKTLKVRTQSTLVVFKGATERARVAGETDSAKLAATLRSAL